MKTIYMDNAATTAVSEEVLQAMIPYFRENYGNPSAVYSLASVPRDAMIRARQSVASVIGANPCDIYFTGCGSEADNWAIKAACDAYPGKHIITTKIEHHAVLHTCQYLETKGYEVTYLDVDENGLVDPADVEAAIRPDTVIISVMFANNEIGTIEPIKEIGAIAKAHGILFHTDAVQAFGQVPIDVNDMNIDMLSASAHKLRGPKGVGCLFIRKGVRIKNFMHGGAQERKRRAGTENVAGIVGFGKAAEIALATMEKRSAREVALREHLKQRIMDEIPYTKYNGDPEKRLPGNANFCFRFIEGESMLMWLDSRGICGSSGSACTSGSLDPSHVLLAIGLPHEIAHGSLRLTLTDENSMEDVDFVVDSLKEIVAQLRDMSPLYADFVKKQSK